MTNDIRSAVVGDLRPSQLLYTFGVGSLLDLPRLSVLVMGLDDWNTAYCQPITEERLLSAIRLQLGSQVQRLLMPPFDPDESEGPGSRNPFGNQVGVPVASFPGWMRCPKCNRLAPLDSGLFKLKVQHYYPDRTRYVHTNCNKANEPPVLPVRFLIACPNGHLDDFPWVEYLHKGRPCSSPRLRLREYGISTDASDIVIYCDSCKAERRMGEAFGPRAEDILPPCRGRHPHLRNYDEAECTESVRVTLLGASNGWFPITLSAISIPSSTEKVRQLVEDNWATLKPATSPEILRAFRQTPLLAALAEFSDDEIWNAIEKKRESGDDEESGGAEGLRVPEWKAFSNPDAAMNTNDFRLRVAYPPAGYGRRIEKTVLVERIREVRALMGFTRIESPGDFMDGEDLPEERRARLSRRDPEWLPAAEVRGEGVFLQFNESAIRKWEQRKAVKELSRVFSSGHIAWRRIRGIEPNDGRFPGIRYVLLHSFAHALMRQFILECGYTAASIRERIYSEEKPENAMAGILIYTAAADSEGTLGGLVSLGEPAILGRHIDQALEQMRLCASDPLCSEHSPAEESASIHAAACHACLFAPETSCERGNKYLDRATLVRTFSTEGAAFFE
ncbi:DUF1998 domain-containing protein [Desulfobacterales bacterium HSG2]|nr:DUF1998 domain-containing protein [Desulfobacterales bacterium HSG2]